MDFGLIKAEKSELKGGDAKENAKTTIEILDGQKGPKRDIVIMNAAAALIAGEKAKSFMEASGIASEAIDSGTARKKLEEIKKFSNSI